MSSKLSLTEKSMLAELLVCGAVTEKEFERATKIPQRGVGVRDQTLDRLRQKGVLQQTLYEEL